MRIAIGSKIRMADSGFKPDRKMVKTIKQVAIELREAKKPLAVERRPITARATEARPTNGDKKELSSVLFQAKNGRKAVWMLWKNWSSVRPGDSNSSVMIAGLMTDAMTRAARPMMMIKIVRTRGKVGRVLMVKRRCGCSSAKLTMNRAR